LKSFSLKPAIVLRLVSIDEVLRCVLGKVPAPD
jgi:hypothetical protein